MEPLRYSSTPGRLSPMDQLQSRLQTLPQPGLRGLYAGIHGSRGEWGVPPTQATYFPDIPNGNYERGLGLIPQMFPQAPQAKVSARPYSYNEGGNVYLTPGADPSTRAHEYEHYQQGPTVMPDNLAGAVAAEYGPSLLSQLMPMASWQSQYKVPTQQTGIGLRLGPTYERDMAWLHNQAQQHGVFGATPLSQSLGRRGNGPAQSITGLMAANPQWFNTATGITPQTAPGIMPPQPVRPQQYGLRGNLPMRPKPMPDLKGYLP